MSPISESVNSYIKFLNKEKPNFLNEAKSKSVPAKGSAEWVKEFQKLKASTYSAGKWTRLADLLGISRANFTNRAGAAAKKAQKLNPNISDEELDQVKAKALDQYLSSFAKRTGTSAGANKAVEIAKETQVAMQAADGLERLGATVEEKIIMLAYYYHNFLAGKKLDAEEAKDFIGKMSEDQPAQKKWLEKFLGKAGIKGDGWESLDTTAGFVLSAMKPSELQKIFNIAGVDAKAPSTLSDVKEKRAKGDPQYSVLDSLEKDDKDKVKLAYLVNKGPRITEDQPATLVQTVIAWYSMIPEFKATALAIAKALKKVPTKDNRDDTIEYAYERFFGGLPKSIQDVMQKEIASGAADIEDIQNAISGGGIKAATKHRVATESTYYNKEENNMVNEIKKEDVKYWREVLGAMEPENLTDEQAEAKVSKQQFRVYLTKIFPDLAAKINAVAVPEFDTFKAALAQAIEMFAQEGSQRAAGTRVQKVVSRVGRLVQSTEEQVEQDAPNGVMEKKDKRTPLSQSKLDRIADMLDVSPADGSFAPQEKVAFANIVGQLIDLFDAPGIQAKGAKFDRMVDYLNSALADAKKREKV